MQARTAFAGRNRRRLGRNRHHPGEIIATRERSGQAGVHERPDGRITPAERRRRRLHRLGRSTDAAAPLDAGPNGLRRAEWSPPGWNRHHLGEIIASRARSGQAGVHERPDRWITSAQRTPATPPPTGPPDRRLGTSSWYGPERSSPGRDRRHMRIVTTRGRRHRGTSPAGRERHQPGEIVTSRARSGEAGVHERPDRRITPARRTPAAPPSIGHPTGKLHHPRRLDDPRRACLAEAAQLSALIFPRRMRSCFSASSSSTAASSSVRRSFT